MTDNARESAFMKNNVHQVAAMSLSTMGSFALVAMKDMRRLMVYALKSYLILGLVVLLVGVSVSNVVQGISFTKEDAMPLD